MHKNLFFIGIILAAAGLLSPPLALAAGLAYGLLVTHPYHLDSKRLAKFLLQAAVVCLGFGMNLSEVIKVGRSGFLYTAIGISFALLLGTLLGKLLRVQQTQSFLISAGTAICGGSAIAALGPVTNANEEEMAVSLGTVFVLNSVALFLFPFIGARMHLSQTQFGLWSALAIHDTSSVVGAAAKYGALALTIGTTVKLARALWIVPVAVVASAVKKSKSAIQLPWFILFFCLAAVANSYFPVLHPAYAAAYRLGKLGLAVTLFLIGTGISRTTLKEVGARPMIQGLILWIVVAGISLFAIARGIIHL
ncbi:YeiH family protein [Acidipila rosea]|uniref:Putative integral membrane protein (TIGR00698 family) n=1 Tax=Acidipila rosea TaxID=768535 RepID=A0A4V2PVN7_9BACT|nr:putative sulfate exporter family transporter [Acidipila rosea]MBW4045990.1 putative sulfate exporter family transporter [Acidobacteriota bacterium]TCK75121.1 putative integral membrane protein (TIGR00698 family) [Acidipila rosea]